MNTLLTLSLYQVCLAGACCSSGRSSEHGAQHSIACVLSRKAVCPALAARLAASKNKEVTACGRPSRTRLAR
eukprot:240051-Alexandrium_andersonii.AAC.1